MALLGGQLNLGGPPPSGSTSSLWKTVAEIISDAAIEEGLASAPIQDPYGSPDQNILQLAGLLKSAGRGLVRERGWTHLQKEYSFVTTAGQAAYTLPSDFREMVPQTGWDRTSIYELGGPIGAQVWQATKAFPSMASIRPWIRFQGGQISIAPTPTSAQTIAFEYGSWYWIMPAGKTSPAADAPSAATDVVCFNSDLMVRALKLGWEKAKRMDTTTSQADYDRALASEMNADAAAPTIYLGKSEGSPAQDVWGNVPQTGIGQ